MPHERFYMSNTTVDVSAPADGGDGATVVEAVTETVATDKPDTLGENGIKALQAERDARSEAEKKARDLESRLQEIEDANKSEAEKAEAELQRRMDDLDARDAAIAAQEYDLLKREVATAKGLPADLAARLQGDDKKALEADADALLALVVPSSDPRKPKPVGNLGGSNQNLSAREQFAALMENNL